MNDEMFAQSAVKEAHVSPNEPPQTFKRRVWRYAPLLIFILVIYINSTGVMSASSTGRILRPLLEAIFGELTNAQFLFAQLIVRKLAHLAQYAVLGWLAARAFSTSSRGWLRRNWLVASLILIAALAGLDEYHQSLVPSRTGTPYDTLIDIAGGAGALALFALWRRRRLERKAETRP